MCGIAGVIKIHEPSDGPPPPHLEAIPEAWLDVLDESIKHRGPDGQGRFRDRAVRDDGTVVDVALVHRRLSIIDHEGGHQPMVHDGERLRPDLTYQRGETPIIASEVAPGLPIVAVVFNGCIYNHRELRAELEDAGHVFATDHSDTEVLVHGWREWGERAQQAGVTRDLNGMYACLYWDRQRGICNARRDPFGEKPLLQSRMVAPGVTTWSSTFTGLERLPRSEFPDLDDKPYKPEAVAHIAGWTRHGWNNQRLTDNSWCIDIPPAAEVPNNESDPITDEHFGVIAWLNRDRELTKFDEDAVDTLLRNAVRRRLDSDVPIGCFLSGGIDSSLITRFAIDELGALQTFTVRMPDKRYDESGAAAEIASILGSKHHTLECEMNPAEDLVHLIEQNGMPFGDSSLLPTYWISRAAVEHVRVVLSGDGGDELFCGYQRHQASDLLAKLSLGKQLIPARFIPDRDSKSNASKLRRLLEANKYGAVSLGPELAAIFPRKDLERLICRPHSDWTTLDALGMLARRNSSPRAWDVDEYLTGDLLRKTDTASMSVALEVRCPFLDPALAQAALGASIDSLMPNGERKGLLKRVARRYLPDHIVDRPKQGFAIPVGEWFRSDYGGMRQLLHDHMNSSDPFPGLGDAGVEINMGFVRTMMREHDAAGEKSINPWHGRDHSQRLYMVLVLSIWAKWLDRVRKSEL